MRPNNTLTGCLTQTGAVSSDMQREASKGRQSLPLDDYLDSAVDDNSEEDLDLLLASLGWGIGGSVRGFVDAAELSVVAQVRGFTRFAVCTLTLQHLTVNEEISHNDAAHFEIRMWKILPRDWAMRSCSARKPPFPSLSFQQMSWEERWPRAPPFTRRGQSCSHRMCSTVLSSFSRRLLGKLCSPVRCLVVVCDCVVCAVLYTQHPSMTLMLSDRCDHSDGQQKM